MYCGLLAGKTGYYKKNPKGVSGMCKLMEDRLDESVCNRNIRIVRTCSHRYADRLLTNSVHHILPSLSGQKTAGRD